MVVERILDLMFMVTLLPFTLASVETLPDEFRAAALGAGVIAVIAILVLIVAANQRPRVRRFVTAVILKTKSLANKLSLKQNKPRLLARIIQGIAHLNTDAWVRRVDDLLKGLDSLTRLKDGVILVVLSISIWIPIIFAYQVSLQAAGLNVSTTMAAFVVFAAALSVAAPSSPGAIGVFQAGVIAALQILGQPEAASASFAFAYHITNYVVLTVLGLIGLLATGSTIRSVIDTTQRYLKREKTVSRNP